MRSRRSSILFGAALALTLAFPATGRADDKDNDKKAATDVVVHFGQPQPQTPAPAPVGAAVTHFLFPDDVTIRKGGTVNFVVNGGGHGIAIHPVSKKTTREDIAEDLCQGPAGTAESDRAARAAVCNGTVATPATVDGVAVVVVGTQNLDYSITDGKDDLIIHTGFNAATQVNPRVDDTEHTHRLLGTSGRVRTCGPGEAAPNCDASAPGANPAGALLTGSAPPATPGNRINVQFMKTGRYLVICMNRAHSLNDHMFGFVSVVGDGDDDEDK
jgi:plastocyanin